MCAHALTIPFIKSGHVINITGKHLKLKLLNSNWHTIVAMKSKIDKHKLENWPQIKKHFTFSF